MKVNLTKALCKLTVKEYFLKDLSNIIKQELSGLSPHKAYQFDQPPTDENTFTRVKDSKQESKDWKTFWIS